jgi:diguanylate cyclase (GGDEF)-like protein
MLQSLVSKIEGELPPEFEEKYRLQYLRDDVRQAMICISLLTVSIVAFIYNDYNLLGLNQTFYVILSLRLLLLINTIILLIYLRSVKTRQSYEWLTFSWVLMGIALLVLIDYTRPPDYFFHIAIDIIAILIIYFGIPNRLLLWLLAAILLTVSNIYLMIFVKEYITDTIIFTSILALLLVNIGGLFITRRMNIYKRKYFMTSYELDKLASNDSLTNILNRRMFLELSEKELARYKRYDNDFSMLIMDIDHFKNINDTYGHMEGDKVLKEFVRIISSRIRSSDIFGRIGGDEFGLLLLETSLEKVSNIAIQIRSACKAATIITDDNKEIKFTISIGLTETRKNDTNLDEIIRRADMALYKAKQAGKDKSESL